MLENCAMSGAFFETYVVSEIIKNLYAYNKDPSANLFYYRDTDFKEIDLLFVESGKIYPIEIKKGTSPKKPAKNFNVLEKFKLNIMTGFVIDTCDRIRAINENTYSFPVYLL